MLIDPADGLNSFGVETDSARLGNTGRFTVQLAIAQRFRAIDDGITFEKLFTGYADKTLPNTDGLEPSPLYRASGVLSVGIRRYAEGEGYQTIHLPYTGHRIGMTVILPKKPDGLAADPAIMGDMAVDHEESAVADHRLTAALDGAAVHGDAFADDAIRPDAEACRLALVDDGLWRAAERGEGMDDGACADRRAALDVDVGNETAILADDDIAAGSSTGEIRLTRSTSDIPLEVTQLRVISTDPAVTVSLDRDSASLVTVTTARSPSAGASRMMVSRRRTFSSQPPASFR